MDLVGGEVMKPAAIYCRVSSQEQAERGLSIAAQKQALYDYAARNVE